MQCQARCCQRGCQQRCPRRHQSRYRTSTTGADSRPRLSDCVLELLQTTEPVECHSTRAPARPHRRPPHPPRKNYGSIFRGAQPSTPTGTGVLAGSSMSEAASHWLSTSCSPVARRSPSVQGTFPHACPAQSAIPGKRGEPASGATGAPPPPAPPSQWARITFSATINRPRLRLIPTETTVPVRLSRSRRA